MLLRKIAKLHEFVILCSEISYILEIKIINLEKKREIRFVVKKAKFATYLEN